MQYKVSYLDSAKYDDTKELELLLNGMALDGWLLHSIVPIVNGGNIDHYVITFMKED